MHKPEWALRLEEQYGLPFEQIPGTVYILHWDKPTVILSVSYDYGIGASSEPITHYVGWTQQSDPKKRYNNHSRVKDGTRHNLVEVKKGTPNDEEELKRNGNCPHCGESLKKSLVGPNGLKFDRN
jgi:hypothetical protein